MVERNGKREKNNSEGEGLDLALLSNARQVGCEGHNVHLRKDKNLNDEAYLSFCDKIL